MTTILELVAQQVARRPDRPAVICGGDTLTYRQLWDRASRLARDLAGHRAPAGGVIALYGPGNADFTVATLATWMAGLAWVPIDAQLPADRVAYLIEDSEAVLVVASDPDRPAPSTPLPVLPARSASAPLPPGEVGPQDLAYVIYTSGSTGRPKGVCVEHGPLATHLLGVIDGYGLRDDDVAISLSSPSFDAAVEEVWTILAMGGTVVLRGAALWTAPTVFARVERHQATVLTCPTAYFETLLVPPPGPAQATAARSLRAVYFGGEAVNPDAVREWSNGPLGHISIYNTYGPTEAIVTTTRYRIDKGWAGADRVPIGSYLDGHHGVVLAPDGRQCAPGEPGELYLGGPCLARGYLNRPELTRDRFVQLPGHPGRWYRTGDVVAVHDGDLVFHGRVDRQVKLRGYRIELDEVEHTLRGIDLVRQAAVQLEQRPDGRPTIVAYVVANRPDQGDEAVSPDRIRALALAALPRYMVPDQVRLLDELPLGAAGKVDRSRLRDQPHDNQASTGRPQGGAMTRVPGRTHPSSLYAWFARSAAAHPADPALEIGEHVVTYAHLDAMAGHLAGRLVEANGGHRPVRVGLLAGRTVAAYAGYLAVQRLGATVVPLNPSFPAARNGAITAAAGVDLVLAQQTAAGVPLPTTVLAVADADLLAVDPTCDHAAPASPRVAPTDLAYILFTSGSTGVPKGVPIQHRNACAYLAHIIDHLEVGPGSRVSQTFDLTFDVSVLDMFAALGSGATLVVPARNDILAPVRFVQRRRLTHWFSVPSVISVAQRLHALAPASMPTLRRSLFAGEPLTLQQARAWQAAAPNSLVENGYGPTELTVTCTGYVLPRDPAAWPDSHNGTVPIGPGFASLDYLVLDEYGRPAGEGELCVRGPQRFPGYLDPAQNAGRFLAFDDEVAAPYDPATALTSDYFYRTGDLVRATEHGYVHCGRLDQQIKIRGYRVELGEIEAVLRDQSGVRDAVVIARTSARGEVVLEAAYTGSVQDPEDLLSALRSRLPAYMVPATVVAFDDFPLNANGKIDRRALSEVLSR